MKKLYYLATCDTCKRIMKTWDLPADFEQIEIKSQGISEADLEAMVDLAGSYEALFNKRARLYRERDLKNQNLDEAAFKALLLEHYTFLKRPVLIHGDRIFIGNSAKTVAEAKESLS